MQPVICALQLAAMAKQRKNHNAHVGALSDAQKAARRAADRVRKQKQRSGLKARGLKETVSDASKARHQLRERTQRRWINGKRVWLPVQQGPRTAEQLARDAMNSRLMAEEEAAQAAYYQCLHLSGFKAPAEPEGSFSEDGSIADYTDVDEEQGRVGKALSTQPLMH
jgi:hypothetical protein